jgi:probable HAF family extracellular repeat protein
MPVYTYTTLDDPSATNGTQAVGINDAGQIVGWYDNASGSNGFLYSGGTYTTLDAPLGAKDTFLSGINDAGQIVGNYFDSSVHSSSNEHGFFANPVTIPAVAVEASMYDATGTSAEITSLTTNFLPAQVANATNQGLNPQVYACEALGLVFAFGNETGSTAFSNNFGPSNSAMANSTAGDAAFAAAASNTIFGSASTTNLVNVLEGFIANWKAFYTANGVPGEGNSAVAIDLAARGASWGDMVGVALENELGPLSGQVTNFLVDAAQGTAVYGVSLIGQPLHHAFRPLSCS